MYLEGHNGLVYCFVCYEQGEEYELLEALLEDVFWVNAKNKAG
jgi:hypothetical protein